MTGFHIFFPIISVLLEKFSELLKEGCVGVCEGVSSHRHLVGLRMFCSLTGLPTLSFFRMPYGPSATRRLQIESGAERKRKMRRRRWKQRPNCGKVGWSRWLSRSTVWPSRCNGTGMSSRGSFGRMGWGPWVSLCCGRVSVFGKGAFWHGHRQMHIRLDWVGGVILTRGVVEIFQTLEPRIL